MWCTFFLKKGPAEDILVMIWISRNGMEGVHKGLQTLTCQCQFPLVCNNIF